MAKKKIAAALSLIILVGLLTNAKNIRTQLSYISGSGGQGQGVVAPKYNKPSVARGSSSRNPSNYDVAAVDCLKARNDTVPASLYHELPKPFINLGFPKMGTTSLHEFFKCGGLTSYHLKCGKGMGCVGCIRESIEAGLPPLSKCDGADMYAQIDNGGYFPQIENLDDLVHGHPNATFFLTFRSMEKWYHSIQHWPPRKNGPHMDERWKKFNITGSPSEEGESNQQEFDDWYCKHVKRVRKIVARNPSHTLVEVDIEDPGIAQRMEDMFGIDKSCWGHTNVNANIHADLNESEVVLSKAFTQNNVDDAGGSQAGSAHEDESDDRHGNVQSRKTQSEADSNELIAENPDSDDEEDDDSKQANSAAEITPKGHGDSTDVQERTSDNDDYESHNSEKKGQSQSSGIREIKGSNQSCLRAKDNTVPVSLYHKLPKPFINLGFPKMGTTTLYEYFKCGGFVSSHLSCLEGKGPCAKCMRESVEAGLPPLSKCGKADMYAQIDDGVFFPQIELLEELVHGHPNATFFLTFRSMEKWYHSIQHWPPRKNGPHLDDRWKKSNITGSPSDRGRNMGRSNQQEFDDWYCKHVKRVRQIVARNPSHTLVEVDIEDPGIAQRMEDMFGIDQSCWGHTNVNINIHADLNESEVVLSKAFTRKKVVDAGGSQAGRALQDKSDDGHDIDSGSYNIKENKPSQSSDISEIEYSNQSCLRARNDTVPVSLYHKLPKPFINLGFPKMGTKTLHEFFKCGGFVSSHLRCDRDGGDYGFCARCMEESVKAGLPPLSKCSKADMYTQIDDGRYFPQIELLEELVHGHPKATFFLTFRNIEMWHDSMKHFHQMDRRFVRSNITGSPTTNNPKQFGDWYCNHVERVRQIVAQNPSHTLVEVDIEDPGIAQRMGEIFGIDEGCWGHSNVNADIHPELDPSEVGLNKDSAKKRDIGDTEKKKTGRRKKTAVTIKQG